jgi:uncharacterized protein
VLLSFRFANHRSFRDEQQLNLLPVYDGDSESPFDAVRVVGIFGANASGKSNVISAFSYLSDMVGESDRQSEPGVGPMRRPFRLDPAIAALPSHYAVDLMIDSVRHTYGFSVDDDQILEEWLYTYPLRKKRVVFERAGQDFHWGDEAGRSNVRKLADIVAPTALFLSVAARFDPQRTREGDRDETTAALHDTFTWLWQRVSRDSHITTARGRALRYSVWLADPAIRTAVVDLLRAADIGLKDVLAEPPQGLNRAQVQFVHQGAADDVSFGIADESSGTLRLLELAAGAIPILESGGLFLVDEIDASLHPLLTASLVQLFQSPVVNKRRAQLIFTTHDATLLGSIDGDDVLQRDQVWFTAKGDDGASELFPLAEFKPRRQGENRQKRYLNGSYGAIPEISMRVFEQAMTSRVDTNVE